MLTRTPKLRYNPTMYRAGPPSEMPRGKTAYEVIRYEYEDLGNWLHIYATDEILKMIPAKKLLWLYPEEANALGSELLPVTEYRLRGLVVTLAMDFDGGELVYVQSGHA